MKSQLNAVDRMVCTSPASVMQHTAITGRSGAVHVRCWTTAFPGQQPICQETPRGAEVTDDIFKHVILQTLPFTFSSGVTASADSSAGVHKLFFFFLSKSCLGESKGCVYMHRMKP